MNIDTKEIEKKWQKKRTSEQIYKVSEDPKKEKFYVLDMFPYPSGAGLHVGHPKGYIATDVLTRKKMLEGFSVLHPMGFDTFGLGTEQYAIDHKMKPQIVAEQNIENFKKQLENMGFSYDRERSFSTADPDYYKRTQRIFLQLYNHYYDEEKKQARPISEYQGTNPDEVRLAYIDYKPINRCPHCKTGLANEDLEDGKCERCGSEVEQRPMRQRVLRITKYADRLLE
jgi:leucyl-tRNA synthetase